MEFMEFCFCRLVGEIWILDEMDGVVESTPAVTGLGFCRVCWDGKTRWPKRTKQWKQVGSMQFEVRMMFAIITSSFKWIRTECDYTWTPGRGQEDILPLLSLLTNNPMQRTNWRFADSIQTTIRTAWKHTWRLGTCARPCQTNPLNQKRQGLQCEVILFWFLISFLLVPTTNTIASLSMCLLFRFCWCLEDPLCSASLKELVPKYSIMSYTVLHMYHLETSTLLPLPPKKTSPNLDSKTTQISIGKPLPTSSQTSAPRVVGSGGTFAESFRLGFCSPKPRCGWDTNGWMLGVYIHRTDWNF